MCLQRPLRSEPLWTCMCATHTKQISAPRSQHEAAPLILLVVGSCGKMDACTTSFAPSNMTQFLLDLHRRLADVGVGVDLRQLLHIGKLQEAEKRRTHYETLKGVRRDEVEDGLRTRTKECREW